MVSISKYRDTIRYWYQTFKVSSVDVILGYQYIFRQLNSLCRDFQIYMVVLAYRIYTYSASIEHNSGIVRYRRNYGIVPALTRMSLWMFQDQSVMAKQVPFLLLSSCVLRQLSVSWAEKSIAEQT